VVLRKTGEESGRQGGGRPTSGSVSAAWQLVVPTPLAVTAARGRCREAGRRYLAADDRVVRSEETGWLLLHQAERVDGRRSTVDAYLAPGCWSCNGSRYPSAALLCRGLVFWPTRAADDAQRKRRRIRAQGDEAGRIVFRNAKSHRLAMAALPC
jgi:hypothetical protein